MEIDLNNKVYLKCANKFLNLTVVVGLKFCGDCDNNFKCMRHYQCSVVIVCTKVNCNCTFRYTANSEE